MVEGAPGDGSGANGDEGASESKASLCPGVAIAADRVLSLKVLPVIVNAPTELATLPKPMTRPLPSPQQMAAADAHSDVCPVPARGGTGVAIAADRGVIAKGAIGDGRNAAPESMAPPKVVPA